MDLKLKGKIIVVTGASRGMGMASAGVLCEEGARVVISSRSDKNLKPAAARIEAETGNKPAVFAADISRLDDILSLKEWILDEFSTVHGILINAGGPPTGPSTSHNEGEWDSAIKTNLMSVIRITREFVPVMKKQKFGRIVAITSSSAKQPLDNLVLSNTTRAGVHGYLKTLANEVGKDDILVNALMPGPTNTERLQNILKNRADKEGIPLEEVIAGRTARIPVGRFGEPEELGTLAAFLLSGRNTYLTGQSIAVDGGYLKAVL